MSQNVYPTSDVTNQWASGTYADIDEGATPSDSDFAYSNDKPASEVFEFHLGDPTDPEVHTGHVVRYRWATVDGGVLSGDGTAVTQTYNLYQGTTLISTGTGNTHTTNSATFSDASFTLSEAEAGSITDYTDLRVRVVASGGAGSGPDRRGAAISWAELETPDAPSTDRQAIVTAFELEVPTAPRKAIVTAFEFEIPNADRKAVVTAFEFEVPTAPRQAIVTAFELETPDFERQAIVTAFEFEIGDAAAHFRMALSDHITASGENTTGQLTAPAGKTTGDFGGGRIQDDENPGDTVDLDYDEYREDEWCILATDAAVGAAVYQFRVLLNAATLTTYTVDPRWTIGVSNDRQAIVTAFELETEDAARQALVTAFELETEDAARQALVTAFELETEDAARQALVTAFELETEDAARQALVTAFELETEDAARQAVVTAFELETDHATELEGYRWRDDDNDEINATWLQLQDVDITRPIDTNTRLRTLVDAAGDPPTGQATLQFRKVGDAGWETVQ
jgi:hypothetical protein